MMSTTLPRSDLGHGLTGWQQGEGRPLLLIHGVGLQADAWLPMAPMLTPHFAVTAVDMPGHGKSEKLSGTPSLVEYTDRIAKIIDAPSVVIGHSMGALIAIDLAVRYPEKVQAIVPLNAVFQRSDEAATAVLARAENMAAGSGTDPGPTLDRWFGAASAAEAPASRAACERWLREVDQAAYAQAYLAFATATDPSDEDLAAIACPALLMTGELEPNSTPDMSFALAKRMGHAKVAIVPQARHMMPMTHADEVCGTLYTFVLNTLGT